MRAILPKNGWLAFLVSGYLFLVLVHLINLELNLPPMFFKCQLIQPLLPASGARGSSLVP